MADHRCQRAEHCSEVELERDAEGTVTARHGALIPEAYGLCHACRDKLRDAIRHLTLDVAELTMLMPSGGGGVGGQRVGYTPEPPLPIRVGIEALRAEIDNEVQVWVEVVAERLGVEWDTEGARRSRIGHRVQRAVDLLAVSTDTLLGLPPVELSAWIDGEPVWDHDLDCQDVIETDGVQGAMRLMTLHHKAFLAAGRAKLVIHLDARCMHCDQRTLVRENGASSVVCRSDQCRGREVHERHYDWFVAITLQEEQRRLAA